jgi:Tfp pilus assembly protein PilO
VGLVEEANIQTLGFLLVEMLCSQGQLLEDLVSRAETDHQVVQVHHAGMAEAAEAQEQ